MQRHRQQGCDSDKSAQDNLPWRMKNESNEAVEKIFSWTHRAVNQME
jgi:hypothetical protein